MRMIACGDIALCKGIESMILSREQGELAKDFRSIFHEADIFLANVECPLTDSESPAWDYFPTLKGKRDVGRILGDLGVTIASLANNHIADYGLRGLEDTISVLEEQGIAWVGAGWAPEEASEPLIIDKGDCKIGILALAQPEISAAKRGKWGAGVLEYDAAIKTMERLAREVDVAIAYLHFGVEFFEYPTPHQVRFSRSLIDHGALLVLGHHPHVPQGYEHYKNGFIAYSLGNFIFDMPGGTHKFSRLGLLVKAEIEKDGIKSVEVIPVDTSGGNPRLLRDDEGKEAEDYLRRLSLVIEDKNELGKAYYFTCKGNFNIFLGALIQYGLKKGNLRRIKDLLLAQLWPQLFQLRIDLLRFMFSGDALRFEKMRNVGSTGLAGRIWRGFCGLCSLVAYPWGRYLEIR